MEDSVICFIFVYIHVYTFFSLEYISIRSIYNLSVYYNHVCVGGRQGNEVEPRGDANSATCYLSRCTWSGSAGRRAGTCCRYIFMSFTKIGILRIHFCVCF